MSQIKGIMDVDIITKVKFYNLSHGKKFLNGANYPSSVIDNIRHFVKNGCVIKGVDFVLYTLFHNKGYGFTQNDFSSKVVSMEDMLSLHISALNSSIQKKYKNKALPRGVTDNIGESIGMLVISHCHGIANADWDVIPESNKSKTLDFKLAISASGIVQLETKGTSAVRLAITKPYADICKKKTANPVSSGDYSYGTIATIDTKEVCCYLVDPPGNDNKVDVTYVRIVSRLQYYLRILNIIAPKSELIGVVETRIKQLLDKEIDYKENIELKPANNFVFNYSSGNKPSYFFNAYYNSELSGGFGGRCFFIDSNNMLFVGVTTGLLIEIVEQNSEFISRELTAESVNVDVSMNMPVNALHQKGTDGLRIVSEERFYNVDESLTAEGKLHFNNGVVIGVLSY